ncbi:MAG: hypothetical protein IT352_15455 [Gemmatimonadales bacterium]|nr:hypothetical protein [Gemmatimonadales bacterium]
MTRDASGRFVRTAAASPPIPPGEARRPRFAPPVSPEPPPLVDLHLEPVSPEPPALDVAELPPLEGEGPATDAAAAAGEVRETIGDLGAKLVNELVRMALGDEYAADDARVGRVAETAQPVITRVSERFGLGAAASSTLPPWVTEVTTLGAAVYMAWGDAIIETWRTALAARRAQRETEDAEDRQASDDDGRGGSAARGGPGRRAPGRDAARGGDRGPDGAPRGGGRDGDGAGYGPRLVGGLGRYGGAGS